MVLGRGSRTIERTTKVYMPWYFRTLSTIVACATYQYFCDRADKLRSQLPSQYIDRGCWKRVTHEHAHCSAGDAHASAVVEQQMVESADPPCHSVFEHSFSLKINNSSRPPPSDLRRPPYPTMLRLVDQKMSIILSPGIVGVHYQMVKYLQ